MRGVTVVGERDGKPIVAAEPSLCAHCACPTTRWDSARLRELDGYLVPTPVPPWDYYMVHDDIWESTGVGDGFLHVACLEVKLGYQLTRADFTDAPINNPSDLDSRYLRAVRARAA